MPIQNRHLQQAPGDTQHSLHVCRDCASRLVHPLDWEAAGGGAWRVTLRCPNCERQQTGTFDQATVDSFDEELDIGVEVLLRDLRELSHENMTGYVERFTGALRADAILPEDF